LHEPTSILRYTYNVCFVCQVHFIIQGYLQNTVHTIHIKHDLRQSSLCTPGYVLAVPIKGGLVFIHKYNVNCRVLNYPPLKPAFNHSQPIYILKSRSVTSTFKLPSGQSTYPPVGIISSGVYLKFSIHFLYDVPSTLSS